jgi:hypothetical protein
MSEQEIRKEFEEKVRRGVFRRVARYVTRAADPEERLAEAVAMTFELYAAHARRGDLLDDGVLVHHCRLRARDLGRHLVRGEHSALDVLDPRCFHSGNVEVLHLDGLPGDDGSFHGEEDGTVLADVLDGLARDPAPKLDSALDLTRWLATLPAGDQAMLAARYAGCTLAETARVTGSSTTTAFARLRRLGGELAQRAGVALTKKRRKPRSARTNHARLCPA